MRELVVAAIASGVITLTVSKGLIFERQRLWVREKSPWLGELVGCPYCLSHWVAALAQIWFRIRLTDTWLPVDLICGWLVIVAGANLVAGIIYRIYKGATD